MELSELMSAVIVGIISSAGTIAAIKTDIHWIKRECERLDKRISKLEEQP